MPNRKDLKMIAVSSETHAILLARSQSQALSKQTMEQVILELLQIADKHDRMTHRGAYSRKKVLQE